MNRKKLLPKLMVRWSIKEADRLEDLEVPEDLEGQYHLFRLEDPEDRFHLEYLEDLFHLECLEDPEDPEDRFRLEYLEDPEDLPIALGFPIRFQSIDISYRGHFRRHYTYRQFQR